MSAVPRRYDRAWIDATLSFLDNLLVLCLMVGLPAMLLGIATHNLLDHLPTRRLPETWLFLHSFMDLLVLPIALAAATAISRQSSFYQPSALNILSELANNGTRLFLLALLLTVVIHPSMYVFGVGIPLLCLLIGLLHPTRWLEGGHLWDSTQRGGWIVLITSLPLWLIAPVFLLFMAGLEFWSIDESTAIMTGISLMIRSLVLVWGWTILLRLYRVRHPEFS